MENEQKEVVEPIEEVDEIVETKDEFENDLTDWKSLALKNQGIAKRFKTKLEKSKEVKAEVESVEKPIEKKSFDYAEKAYLKASGLSEEEFPKALKVMQETGRDLGEVLNAKYFQAELKEGRDIEASKKAIPEGTKRSSPTTQDTVEYWITKGELPPVDQRELRQQVVNAKMKKSSDKSMFSDNPVA